MSEKFPVPIKEKMSASRADTIIMATRETAKKSLADLGFPIAAGTVNLDNRSLTEEDVATFEKNFDAATKEALKTYFDIQETTDSQT